MDIGVIGMAVMGRNLAMNAAEKGFKVAAFNRTAARTDEAVQQAKEQGLELHGFHNITDFVASLSKPRKVIMMVQAGTGVDATIKQLVDILEDGDILIDGGNEHWRNTDRRISEIAATHPKLHYMAMGVSGGEEGARHGPSIMPGGNKEAWEHMKPILTKIAAKGVDGMTCCDYMGEGSAGNYVKMVHNGIEYGDMQLIAETYDFMRKVLKWKNDEIQRVFEFWNRDGSQLKSYLIEITSHIFKVKDPKAKFEYLVDAVLDVAGSKGTGKWTVQEAAELATPCPTIAAALDSRHLSGMRKTRADVGSLNDLHPTLEEGGNGGPSEKSEIGAALLTAKICSYAQGMKLLSAASEAHKYGIDLAKVSLIWSGGCIIRADFLKSIHEAYKADPGLDTLLMSPWFANELRTGVKYLRQLVCTAQALGVPVPGMAASLNYLDTLSASELPLNLVQAQRDYFGAHEYVRRDEESQGPVHSDWLVGEGGSQ